MAISWWYVTCTLVHLCSTCLCFARYKMINRMFCNFFHNESKPLDSFTRHFRTEFVIFNINSVYSYKTDFKRSNRAAPLSPNGLMPYHTTVLATFFVLYRPTKPQSPDVYAHTCKFVTPPKTFGRTVSGSGDDGTAAYHYRHATRPRRSMTGGHGDNRSTAVITNDAIGT